MRDFDPLFEGERHNMFDRTFPLRVKYVERPDRMGAEEVQDQNVGYISGELELIARTSYRLGHAEATASSSMNEARRERQNVKDYAERLENTRRDLQYNESRVEIGERTIAELQAELEKKDKQLEKLKPKKKAPAKKKGTTK